MSHLSVAFVLFPNVTQLDLTGPAQVLSRLSDATCHLVATSHAPVATDAGFSIVPTTTFGELPRPDIICVPGGAGRQQLAGECDARTHGVGGRPARRGHRV